MSNIGPVELLSASFEAGAEYQGRILSELERLEREGTVRVLDLLFLGEDESTGELRALDYRSEELGSVVSGLLGFPFNGVVADPVVVEAAAGTGDVGVVRARLEELVAQKRPDIAMAFVLLEHVWARDFRRAIGEAGGQVLSDELLTADAIRTIAARMA